MMPDSKPLVMPPKSLLLSIRSTSVLADRLLFAVGGATASLLLYIFFYSPLNSVAFAPSATPQVPPPAPFEPSGTTFYDDPTLSYTIDRPISNWDEKRRQWFLQHPSFAADRSKRILMVTGSSPGACSNAGGDHLLLRFFKNKADYCRIHGIDIFYNTAVLHPGMPGAWAKIALLRAAMVAHPEAEWIWWVDSDAAFTDIEFRLPLRRYRRHNFVVPGYEHMIYVQRSWVGLNAGVFLIRNCQWSLDFMDVWARMGPQSPEFAHWGRTIMAELTDKNTPDSDDQSALVLLLIQQEKWRDKVYIESSYDLHGYWAAVIDRLANATEMYRDMERRTPALRQRRAEKTREGNGLMRERQMEQEVENSAERQRRRLPFVTHFTGCQPCVGGHSPKYTSESCNEGMRLALDFADDQVLRAYGYGRVDPVNGSLDVRPLPFDFPAAAS